MSIKSGAANACSPKKGGKKEQGQPRGHPCVPARINASRENGAGLVVLIDWLLSYKASLP